MKPHSFLFIICSACLFSCSKPSEELTTPEPSPVDSFSISGIDVGQQAQDMRYLNDSTFCSYDLIGKKLVFFHKNKSGNFVATIKKNIDTEFWSMFFIGDDHNNYFIDRYSTITVYDGPANTKLNAYTMRHSFKYLNDTFGLVSGNNTPLFKINDTLITAISPSSDENAKNYFKEQEIAEFKMNTDSNTLTHLRSYITKPSNLSDYEYPLGMYCFLNNTIYLLYPPMDTIYMFNRTTRLTSKIPLHNRDYKLPAKFTCIPFTTEYGSCSTKYYLHNFSYTGIRYNPLTKHFLLFYNAPVSDTIKGRIPTFDDQPLQVLVLDEQFNKINNLFIKKKFMGTPSFFFIPGKGLAMPLFKGDAFETTPFYIYNL